MSQIKVRMKNQMFDPVPFQYRNVVFPQQLAQNQQPNLQVPQKPLDPNADHKARNRIAAKKWREKKDETLYQLEQQNDILRAEALNLRNEALSISTENKVLEDELNYFQTFMTKIMNANQNLPLLMNPNQPQ